MFVWDSWLCYIDRKCRNKYFFRFFFNLFSDIGFQYWYHIFNNDFLTQFSVSILQIEYQKIKICLKINFSDKYCDKPFSNGTMLINFAVDIIYLPVGRGKYQFLYSCPFLIALCCNKNNMFKFDIYL